MFFMMGITDGRKELNYSQTEICSVCGCYGRYQVFRPIPFYHCFLFHVLSGIGIIMYRQAAVIRYMNLTGKLADG